MRSAALTFFFVASAFAAACNRPDLLPETPRVEVSSTQLAFTAPGGGYEPAPSTFTVKSIGGPLTVTGLSARYSDGAGWLSLEVDDPNSSPATVTVAPHTEGLATGIHEATVYVRAGDAVNSPAVKVSLVVPPPVLELSAHLVDIVVADGVVPPPYEVRVTNGGGGILESPSATVTYSSGNDWLSVEVTGSAAPYAVVLRPVLAAITSPGGYAAKVEVRGVGEQVSRDVWVNLYVAAPSLVLSSGVVSFLYAQDGVAPAPRSVTMKPTPVSGVALSLPTATVEPLGGDADWLEATVTGSGPTYQLTLAPIAAALQGKAAFSQHSVVVRVTAASASVSTSLVAKLEVGPYSYTSLMEPSAEWLSFSALAGGGDPPPQILTVSDGLGGDTMTFDIYSQCWGATYQVFSCLDTAITGSAVPYDVTVRPQVAGLPPGTYLGYLALSGAAVSWVNVDVYIFVQDWAFADETLHPVREHTATPLPDGSILITGGHYYSYGAGFEVLDVGAAWPRPDGSPRAFGYPHDVRTRHAATALADGRVVASGGVDAWSNGEVLRSWEVFEPASGTWRIPRALVTARFDHTATLLPDGRVLLAGGLTGSEGSPATTATAELLDPTDGTSVPTGSLITARSGASAVLLSTGKVLVAGGRGPDGAVLATAELFDPVLGTWSMTGTMMIEARADAALVSLGSGKALVAGGTNGAAALASAERFDAPTGIWSATAPMALGRVAPAVRRPDGKVLLVAGATGDLTTSTATVEAYDPVSRTWSSAGDLNRARSAHTATVLSNGMVVVVGGKSLPSDPIGMSEVEVGFGEAL